MERPRSIPNVVMFYAVSFLLKGGRSGVYKFKAEEYY